MSSAFIFQNQYQQFLTKSNEWVDGSESQLLLKTLFKDEALNIKAEQSVKNPELRLSIVSCGLNAKGRPQITLEKTQSNLDAEALASAPQPASNDIEKPLELLSDH